MSVRTSLYTNEALSASLRELAESLRHLADESDEIEQSPEVESKLEKPSSRPRSLLASGNRRGIPVWTPGSETPNSPQIADWVVGARCYINGNKAGKVAFIGETKFAPGEWAGVILDEPTGRNDGSVYGIRYFQCPPDYGIFCKVKKLERNVSQASSPIQANDLSGSNAARGSVNIIVSPPGPSSALFIPSPPENAPPILEPPPLKLGDRVAYGDKKIGTLRYLGFMAVREGLWAGLELDQPLGKNDGSVDGKRYFACKPRYGLFVPVSMVKRIELVSEAANGGAIMEAMSLRELTEEVESLRKQVRSLKSENKALWKMLLRSQETVTQLRVRLEIAERNDNDEEARSPDNVAKNQVQHALAMKILRSPNNNNSKRQQFRN